MQTDMSKTIRLDVYRMRPEASGVSNGGAGQAMFARGM
jgi:hypothetical protein